MSVNPPPQHYPPGPTHMPLMPNALGHSRQLQQQQAAAAAVQAQQMDRLRAELGEKTEPKYEWRFIDAANVRQLGGNGALREWEFVQVVNLTDTTMVNGSVSAALFRRRLDGIYKELFDAAAKARGDLDQFRRDNAATAELTEALRQHSSDLMCRNAEIMEKDKEIERLKALIAGKCAV